MISNKTPITDGGIQSIYNKSFLYLLGVIIFTWLSVIVYALVAAVNHLIAKTYQTNAFTHTILFLIGSIITITAFVVIVVKKETFYTHLIISEEGLVFLINIDSNLAK